MIPSHEAAQRHHELVGSRIEDVRVDGGLVYLTITHRGTDDEACTLLVRAAETEWLYPTQQVPDRILGIDLTEPNPARESDA